MAEGAEEQQDDDSETIEKILETRIGKKGGKTSVTYKCILINVGRTMRRFV